MSAIKTWSTTAANNNSTPPDGAPEGWAPSKVNDTIREEMAQHRTQWNQAEWFGYGDGDGSATYTYVSATQFKLSGVDVSAEYHVGRRVKATGSLTGTIYGRISAVAFATDTTVTVVWDSGSLSNEALTIELGILKATNPSVPNSAAVRTAMGLGTAAAQNTGTSGANVPLLDGANTWSATQTIQSTDAGATVGPTLVLDRDSASPAASDLIGLVQYLGEDSAGNDEEYAGAFGKIIDPTSTSEDGEYIVRTVVAGTLANRLHVGAGAYTSGATGGDKGADTINAASYYENGTRMNSQGVAKAWVNFNGTGTLAVNDSFNVTSVTDNGTGLYTVNFTTAFAAATYAVAGWARDADASGGDLICSAGSSSAYSTTALGITTRIDTGAASDALTVGVVCFGDQ